MADTTPKPLSLEEFRRQRKPLRNVNKQFNEDISRLNHFAMWITDHIGTMGFFLLIFTWTVLWLGGNTLGPLDCASIPRPLSSSGCSFRT